MNTIAITQDHPLWTQWVELYHHSFPAYEQIPVSEIVEELDMPGARTVAMALIDVSQPSKLLGMAYLEIISEQQAAYLVYLAMDTEMRNQGLGVHLYNAICEYASDADCQLLYFEVEHPSDPHTDTDIAKRRISWYLRHGAEVIDGIEFWQQVSDVQPNVLMYIMVHRLGPVEPLDAINAAMSVFPTASRLPKVCLSSHLRPE